MENPYIYVWIIHTVSVVWLAIRVLDLAGGVGVQPPKRSGGMAGATPHEKDIRQM